MLYSPSLPTAIAPRIAAASPLFSAVVVGAIALTPSLQAHALGKTVPSTKDLQHLATEDLLAKPQLAAQPMQAIAPTPTPVASPIPVLADTSTSAADLIPAVPSDTQSPVTEMPGLAQVPPPPESVEPAPEAVPVYGSRGSRRWYAQGGVAVTTTNDDTRFGLVGAGISHYFAGGHSINLELNTLAVNQPGSDALGLNLATLLRWDFVRQENWSLYIDGGVGIIGTTNPVPSQGSSFNFTPQAGGGATIQLRGDNRLMLGVRWHHISNADTYENNPGLDTILGYVGINFPR